MKKYLPFFFFIIMMDSIENTVAQNLVPNPSFEDYSSCPNDAGEIDLSFGWSAYGNGQNFGNGTPDYCNVCANPNQYPDSLGGVPHNIAGYQQAQSGNAYAGIICYVTTGINIREIIGCQLNSPLEVGATYTVSFKANCSFGGYMANYIACNGVGVKFTAHAYSNDNPIPIDNSPMVYSSAVITDTLNWTTVEGIYTADSAYQYLALGNFIQDAYLDTAHLGSFIFRAYYYIDDVSVVKLNGDGIEELEHNGFSLYPNPADEWVHVQCSETGMHELSIINPLGQVVFRKEENFANGNSISIPVKNLPAGMYSMVLNGEAKMQQYPLLIQR